MLDARFPIFNFECIYYNSRFIVGDRYWLIKQILALSYRSYIAFVAIVYFGIVVGLRMRFWIIREHSRNLQLKLSWDPRTLYKLGAIRNNLSGQVGVNAITLPV